MSAGVKQKLENQDRDRLGRWIVAAAIVHALVLVIASTVAIILTAEYRKHQARLNLQELRQQAVPSTAPWE